MDPVYLTTVIIVLVALVAIPVSLRLWWARQCARRVRAWADEQGYAVIRLHYKYPLGMFGAVLSIVAALVLIIVFTRLFGVCLGTGLGLSALSVIPWGSWYVEIQDEQGGQRHGYVHLVERFVPHWVDVPTGRIRVEWK